MGIVGRLDQYASMLCNEFDETTANNMSITGLGTYYASEFNENIVDIVRDGLVLNLDAGNLSSYPGSGTTWTNLIPGGVNGTLVNGPTYSSVNGGVIVLNGTNQYIDIPINLSTSNYTIMGAARYVTIGGRTFSAKNNNWLMGHWNGTTQNYYAEGWVSGVGAGPSDTNWRIYAATGNYSGDSWAMYVNGVLNVGPNNAGVQGPNGFAIGSSGGTGEFSNSHISNLLVYNRVLTDAEILQNYNALATRYGLTTTGTTAPMSANVFPPYDLVYDEFGGTSFGAGQGRYMRQNTDKSVIVYNEIDEVTDFYGRGIVRGGLLLDLDAGISSSYPGSGTTWTDLTANSTIANLSSTTYTTDAGGGIYFSSSASSANFTATLNFSGGFTLETWIKHTGVVSTARVQRYMTIGSSPLEGPVLRHNSASNGSLHGYLFDSGSTFREIDIAGQILTNTYYHLVYTYDGTTFRLYKNNVQVGTLVATVTLPTLGTTHGLAPGGVEYFEGNMYAARYYNRALRAAEILQNYNALKGRFGL